MLLLLLPTPYLRLQNRRFGRAQIFKSPIPFIYAGLQTTVDDRRRPITSGLNPTLSAILKIPSKNAKIRCRLRGGYFSAGAIAPSPENPVIAGYQERSDGQSILA